MRDILALQRSFHAVPGLLLVLQPDSAFTIVAASAAPGAPISGAPNRPPTSTRQSARLTAVPTAMATSPGLVRPVPSR